ncbi:MAG: acyl-CoA dehydrogenase family protein [Capsulimonadales bacterium]|nr:acyl-CoA dehydrogenase family protein [Capsulimonadales bacterium]
MENAAELSAPPAPTLTAEEEEYLDRARGIADTVLEPRAEEIDRNRRFPRENLDALAQAGLVGVTTPKEWGGLGLSGAFQRRFTETLTAACGTTWFILTQHLGACGQIANSANPSLRERYLKEAAAGRHYIGVSFGHLRRPDPVLRAEPVPGGWRLNGVAPWVTGWPALSGVLYGATLPDNRHIYLYSSAEPRDGIAVSDWQELCAMSASATVEIRLTDVFVPERDFVRYSSREEMAKGDTNNIAGVVALPLGCATGSLRLLRRIAGQRTHLSFIADAANALDAEIEACREEARRWADGPKDRPEYRPNALKARAWAITLGVRAAHMTVAAASGGANALDHPAQRRFREAMFYTLTAQTGDIMAATLERLASPPHVPPEAN